MSLLPGVRLGSYEITSSIGAGGMGEVFRARDSRLDRDVAIKVLPEALAQDRERLARFEREAKLLASLNHPNIAHVYGFENATMPDGASVHFLAMELVEGEDLAERLKRGPLPQDEAIAIAKQIAEGLGEAHEHGIIHRDLKPANVKLTPGGKVKVLDFGLAKAMEGDDGTSAANSLLSHSPTMSRHMTEAGMIMGTAAYMSPEQARGRAVDKRADTWSFGVVLFEMITGRRPFGGETVSEVLAAVIKDEPSWEALPADLPRSVSGVLRRCLVKEPARRIHDIADARLLLEEEEPAAPSRGARPRASRRREALGWAVAALSLLVAATLALRLKAPQEGNPLTLFAITLPSEQRVASIDVPTLALSRDGRKLAITVGTLSGQTMIHVRSFDQGEAHPVPGTEGGSGPFFSPDGSMLGFFAEGRLKTIPLAGGLAQNVAAAGNHRGGVWLDDGTILFVPDYREGLWQVPANGGAAQRILAIQPEKGERTYRWPDSLPGGRGFLFTVGDEDNPNNYDNAAIVAYTPATGQRHTLVKGAQMARFVPPATLVYSRSGTLFGVALDLSRLETVGQAVPILENVDGDPSSGASYFALAGDGTLGYVRGSGGSGGGAERRLTFVDAQGVATSLPLSPRGFRQPRFSPDGSRIAFTVGVASGIASDTEIWIYSLNGGNLSRLTFGGGFYPAWSPRGDRIAFLRNDGNGNRTLWSKPADGSGIEEALVAGGGGSDALLPGSWSTDGRTLALTAMTAPNPSIYLLTPGDKPRLFEKEASAPTLSPDGRWIAYQSPSSGNAQVFVRPLSGEGKWQVSTEFAGYPHWSRDGKHLFYLRIGTRQRPLVVVDVAEGPAFRASPPRVLIPDVSRFVTSTAPMVEWDVAPSGDRFVFAELERSQDQGTRIEVALNWASHLVAPLGHATPVTGSR